MGMSIDNSCDPKPMSKEEIVDTLKTMVFGVQAFERFNAKERETLDKAWNLIDQYENCLKADMITMLEELQLEIVECVDGAEGSLQFEQGVTIAMMQIVEMIQQKINELKAESENK